MQCKLLENLTLHFGQEIQCDGSGRVTGLILSDSFGNPNLPSGYQLKVRKGVHGAGGSLGDLKELTQLSLVKVAFGFAHAIPPQFGTLPKLQTLRIIDCEFIGQIPSGIGSLLQLSELIVHNNRFTGPAIRVRHSLLPQPHSLYTQQIQPVAHFLQLLLFSSVAMSDSILHAVHYSLWWVNVTALQGHRVRSYLSVPQAGWNLPICVILSFGGTLKYYDLAYGGYISLLGRVSFVGPAGVGLPPNLPPALLISLLSCQPLVHSQACLAPLWLVQCCIFFLTGLEAGPCCWTLHPIQQSNGNGP